MPMRSSSHWPLTSWPKSYSCVAFWTFQSIVCCPGCWTLLENEDAAPGKELADTWQIFHRYFSINIFNVSPGASQKKIKPLINNQSTGFSLWQFALGFDHAVALSSSCLSTLKPDFMFRVSLAAHTPLTISVLQVSGVLGSAALDHFSFLFRLQKKNRCKKQSRFRVPHESLAVSLPANTAIPVQFSKTSQSASPSRLKLFKDQCICCLLFRKFG